MCPEEGGAAGLGELRSWWEVPAIAHFCSLFRTAFRLPDFEIEVSSRRCALSPRFSAGSRGPPTWRGVRAARGLGGGHEAGGRHGLPVAPRALAGGGRACFCRRGTPGLSRDFSAGLRARVRARSPLEPRRRRAAAQAGTGTRCGLTRRGPQRRGGSGLGQGRRCSGDARPGRTWRTCGGP
jgi:hypothetical protein